MSLINKSKFTVSFTGGNFRYHNLFHWDWKESCLLWHSISEPKDLTTIGRCKLPAVKTNRYFFPYYDKKDAWISCLKREKISGQIYWWKFTTRIISPCVIGYSLKFTILRIWTPSVFIVPWLENTGRYQLWCYYIWYKER